MNSQKKLGASTALAGEAPFQTETTYKYHQDRSGRQAAILTPPQQQNAYVKKGADRKGHSYEPLKTVFTLGGFSYRQIAREGDFAIYEQSWRKSHNICFEVIRIQRREAEIFPSGRSYPAREVYPSSEQWGQHGWTVLTRDAAFDKLTQQVSPGAPAQLQSGTRLGNRLQQSRTETRNQN